MPQQHVCNYDDLLVLLSRLPESTLKEFEPLVRLPDGSVHRIVALTTDYEGLPDWCIDGHPSLVTED